MPVIPAIHTQPSQQSDTSLQSDLSLQFDSSLQSDSPLQSHPCLQSYLMTKFVEWKPTAPAVVERAKSHVTLSWMEEEPFGFMKKHLLYKVQRKEKIPPWVVVYSGGKTTKTIENLAPSHPHKFRLRVIFKSAAVHLLAREAMKHYVNIGNITRVMENMQTTVESKQIPVKDPEIPTGITEIPERIPDEIHKENDYTVDKDGTNTIFSRTMESKNNLLSYGEGLPRHERNGIQKWLESQWSEETWTSTDTDGTSAMCFCMAVRCGYLKQVQIMLEERPFLMNTINSNNGLTPLATAVRKGELNTVKYLLTLGAEVDQQTTASQTPLHLAVLAGHTAIADLLLEKGADFQAQDVNGLRVEHYAVDSCKLEVIKHILDRGGDVSVQDSNGWTPLFRAVCQGAATQVIEELLNRGSSVEVTDRRGLTLVAAARLLKNRHGRSRDSVLRLVDPQFPHEKALANFTRLTKKIYSVHTLLK